MDAEFGKRVKAARGYAGEMSQQDLADKLRVGKSTIKRIESGDPGVKGDAHEWASRIEKATGAPADFLLEGWDHAKMEAVVLSLPREAKTLDRLHAMLRAINQLSDDDPLTYYVDRENDLVSIGPASLRHPPGEPMTLEELIKLAGRGVAAPQAPADELARDLADDKTNPRSSGQTSTPKPADGAPGSKR